MKLALVVENTSILEGGSSATIAFSEEGGNIGSSDDATWVLRDRRQSVDPDHVSVDYRDGAFCARITSENGIYVNNASRPTLPGIDFQITNGDRWGLGDFKITTHVVLEDKDDAGDENEASGTSWAKQFGSVDTLVSGKLNSEKKARQTDEVSILSDTWEGEQQREAFTHKDKAEIDQKLDPILQIEGAAADVTAAELDPLALITKGNGAQTSTNQGDKNHSKWSSKTSGVEDLLMKDLEKQPRQGPSPEPLADPMAHQASFVPPSFSGSEPEISNKKEEKWTMNNPAEIDSYLEGLANNSSKPTAALQEQEATWSGHLTEAETNSDSEQIDHVVLRPLFSAMGLSVADLSGPQANAVAKLVGETVKAAVTGLMKLENDQQTKSQGKTETQLHPIVDNPLQLEGDPESALRSLFLLQSPVHLSARAAIEESLDQVSKRERASNVAVEAALDVVLAALAPEKMMRRFERYKGHAPRTGDLDAWHWQMYGHYYQEIASSKQRGLNRMFHEVFDQVYDREMREMAKEA